MPLKSLSDLRSVGPATIEDLRRLGIQSIEELANQEAGDLYIRLSVLAGQRQDPCVYDVFQCAIAQAKDPNLSPDEQRWWTWSWRRKVGRLHLPELPDLPPPPRRPKSGGRGSRRKLPQAEVPPVSLGAPVEIPVEIKRAL